MASQLENLVATIKSKVRALKKSKNSNKPYVKMDKSSSVKVEIRSRKARKLIDKTLKAADRPGKQPCNNAIFVNSSPKPRSKAALHSKLRHFVSKPVRALHKVRDFYVKSLEDCVDKVGDHGGILDFPMAAPQDSWLPKSFNVNYSKSNDDEKFINF
ncbi:hypothetical protein GQ457_04G003080 [Hibiscus cannabinus]